MSNFAILKKDGPVSTVSAKKLKKGTIVKVIEKAFYGYTIEYDGVRLEEVLEDKLIFFDKDNIVEANTLNEVVFRDRCKEIIDELIDNIVKEVANKRFSTYVERMCPKTEHKRVEYLKENMEYIKNLFIAKGYDVELNYEDAHKVVKVQIIVSWYKLSNQTKYTI